MHYSAAILIAFYILIGLYSFYKNDIRITGILRRLGLEDRFITSEESGSFDLDAPINYRRVTKKRLQLAEESFGRLAKALTSENTFVQ